MGGAADRAEDTLHYDMQKLSWSINTHRTPNHMPAIQVGGRWWDKEGEGAPLVVFNPHGFPVKAMVQINNSTSLQVMGAVCDETGHFIPFQKTRSPFVTSGIRVGTPAATSRGLNEPEMKKVAGWIARVLREGEAAVPSIRAQVEAMMAGYPLYQ